MAGHDGERALVLGGGGVAGVAWEIGLLSGLAARGVDLGSADLVVGTSAGSIVGALLRTGEDPEQLYAAQLAPVPAAEPAVRFDGAAFMASFARVLAGATGQQDARARIGSLALQAGTAPEDDRRGIIAARLGGDRSWPAARLVVTVVDAADGEFRAIDAESGVGLVDAVAASCAVPGVWPTVTIDGRRYMDGGMRSPTNADLATGHRRVLVVAPVPGMPGSPLGPGLDQELEELRGGGAQVHVVTADEAALRAFGTNPLDPATREPAARAGRDQATREVDAIRRFWADGTA
ncbi:patatin-like phospholipase family protein [Pseudonocardia humida]|uniref:Patatin-like phospholipase family protein n=1 Tax=Pseudonocardia humida TaxID=2800819 RepID=A0ABT0ZVC1_9PSEU|nr:patatin-like phospholipase family protein [Pseudonocardia humida]MCO1654685.1 patatin-like phospholipase family protein [Pseudonocardia humida]